MPEDKVSKNIESGVLEKPEKAAVETGAGIEQGAEQKFEAAKVESSQPVEKQGEAVAAPRIIPAIKTPTEIRAEQIDKILSEDLEEAFLSMPPKKQAEFQKEGEVTVKKINELLSQTKVNFKKIVDLIKRWLKLIPGVNKFFLEQEAKIKTDKIVKIKS